MIAVVSRPVLIIFLLLSACASNQYQGGEEGETAEDNSPPELDVGVVERLIHQQVNNQREQHGLNALSWDDELAGIARNHSLDMAQNDFFSHAGSSGSSPADRATDAEYECMKDEGEYRYTGIAENIFMTYRYGSRQTRYGPNGTTVWFDWKTQDQIAREVVGGWMNSPGHRANILQGRHDLQGLGIVQAGDQLYITQNLC